MIPYALLIAICLYLVYAFTNANDTIKYLKGRLESNVSHAKFVIDEYEKVDTSSIYSRAHLHNSLGGSSNSKEALAASDRYVKKVGEASKLYNKSLREAFNELIQSSNTNAQHNNEKV